MPIAKVEITALFWRALVVYNGIEAGKNASPQSMKGIPQ
jgi:hypothetical protein